MYNLHQPHHHHQHHQHTNINHTNPPKPPPTPPTPPITTTTTTTGTMSVIGEAKLQLFYNDGHKGTGTADEMALEERSKLAVDGIIVASIDIMRVMGNMQPVNRRLTDDEVWVRVWVEGGGCGVVGVGWRV